MSLSSHANRSDTHGDRQVEKEGDKEREAPFTSCACLCVPEVSGHVRGIIVCELAGCGLIIYTLQLEVLWASLQLLIVKALLLA